jgi:hypothetical protein
LKRLVLEIPKTHFTSNAREPNQNRHRQSGYDRKIASLIIPKSQERPPAASERAFRQFA